MALERVIFEHNSASARRLLVGRSSLGRATLLAHIRLEACCARARPACRDVCCCCCYLFVLFFKIKKYFVCFLINLMEGFTDYVCPECRCVDPSAGLVYCGTCPAGVDSSGVPLNGRSSIASCVTWHRSADIA